MESEVLKLCYGFQGLRPTIPRHTNPSLVKLMKRCWHQEPCLRPEFTEIMETLQQIGSKVWTIFKTCKFYSLRVLLYMTIDTGTGHGEKERELGRKREKAEREICVGKFLYMP